MSSFKASTVVSVYDSAYTGNYCAVAAVALAAYAWVGSLGDEMTLIWRSTRKRTCATMVYALTRYATLAAYIVSIVPLGELPLVSCEAVLWLQVVFTAASNVAAAAFSTLRIYALSKSNKSLATLTFILSIAPCIVDTVFSSKWIEIEEWPSPFYCVKQSTASVELTFRLTTASRICAIVGDLLVAGATWLHAYRATHAHKLAFGPSLGQVMMYEGSVYFVVLASLNLMRIVFSGLAMDNVSSAASDLPIFTDLLGSILISHFILALRKVHQDTNTPLSSLSFVKIEDHDASESLPDFVAPHSGPYHFAEEDRDV